MLLLACYLFLVGGLALGVWSLLLIEIEATKAYCFPLLFLGLLYLLHQASGFEFQDLPLIVVFYSSFICFQIVPPIKNPFTWYWWSFIASLANAV